MRLHLLAYRGLAAVLLLTLSALATASTAAAPHGFDTSPVAQADPGSRLPPDWQHGVFMEVFVRGYQDSNGDGIGDLRGLTQRLDYLHALGIRGLWLMPVTRSADHDHGYAVTDHREIEPDYGSLVDFDELLKQAHARGIGVIVDYVLNHSAAQHPAFVDAAASPTSRFRDWYVWQEPPPTGWNIWGHDPWYAAPTGHYFAVFGPQTPDFNLRNPAVVRYHLDTLRFWLNRGVDGFRFDAVPHLIENSAQDWNDQPESYALMGEVHALLAHYANRTMVCEATASPEAWAAPPVCGSAFAFGLERHVAAAARGEPADIRAVADWFKTAPPTMATMASNHDLFAGQRLWDQLHGDIAQYRLAAATYLLLPGTPFIFYGEEIGLGGDTQFSDDGQLRIPMSWTADPARAGFTRGTPFRPVSPNAAGHNVASEQADPHSLLAFYKAMIRLRNTLPSIARGSYEQPFVQGRVMGYQRQFGDERTLVLINYAGAPVQAHVQGLPAGARLDIAFPLRTDTAVTDDVAPTPLQVDAQGRVTLTLPPQSVRVYVYRGAGRS
jgi:glycosidase